MGRKGCFVTWYVILVYTTTVDRSYTAPTSIGPNTSTHSNVNQTTPGRVSDGVVDKTSNTSHGGVNNTSHGKDNHTHGGGGGGHHGSHTKGIHVFVEMFENVETPFLICCWILLASLAKVVFHHFENLSAAVPESCLLILLGIPVGYILQTGNYTTHLMLTSNLFFQYLLPPIIFDAGYFINTTTFFNNIGTILLYAVVGTIFNTFAVGLSVYGVSGGIGVNISLLHSFLFGSLISAVDPVAVLTVFEEVQVNEVLYMLVFGESVLNDAASVVLYRTFENLPTDVDAEQVGLAIASLLAVSVFGTLIGIAFGLVASFVTRFTDHVRVIEPIFVFIMAYMAYLTAEIFHFSGIMSILFCGVFMKPYVESNVSRKSHITIKYFLKMLSSSCEAVIFMFLGIALVQYSHKFNFKFVISVIVFISVFRAIGTVSLTTLANHFGRLDKINRVEQFIMCYGGLRGAVAFCLAIIINVGSTPEAETLKNTLVTTTLAVIIFTCFVQGGTIKMLVEKLHITRADDRELTMTEHLNEKVLSHMVAGVEEILGIHGHGYWRNMAQMFNRKFLRPCLERNPEEILDDDLFVEQRKIDYKESVADNQSQFDRCDTRSEMSVADWVDRKASCESMMDSTISPYSNPGYVPSDYDTSMDRNAYNNNGYVTSPSPEYGQPQTTLNPMLYGGLADITSIASFNVKEYSHFIPDGNAKRVKSKMRYSDAAVGLHAGEWEEGSHRKQMRDTFGRRVPENMKRSHSHHHSHHNGHRRHHSSHRPSGHHGNGHHHHRSHHDGGHLHHHSSKSHDYRSQKPDTSTIVEDEEAGEERYSSSSGADEREKEKIKEEEVLNEKEDETPVNEADNNSVPTFHINMDEVDEVTEDILRKNKKKESRKKKRKEKRKPDKDTSVYVPQSEIVQENEVSDVFEYVPTLPIDTEPEPTSLYNDTPIPDSEIRRCLSERDVQDLIDHSQKMCPPPISPKSSSSSASSSGGSMNSKRRNRLDLSPSAVELNSPWGMGREPDDGPGVSMSMSSMIPHNQGYIT